MQTDGKRLPGEDWSDKLLEQMKQACIPLPELVELEMQAWEQRQNFLCAQDIASSTYG